MRLRNELRIGRARSLLGYSRLSLKEIADHCGFRDVYYFSAVFTRFTRLAPGQYRLRSQRRTATEPGTAG